MRVILRHEALDKKKSWKILLQIPLMADIDCQESIMSLLTDKHQRLMWLYTRFSHCLHWIVHWTSLLYLFSSWLDFDYIALLYFMRDTVHQKRKVFRNSALKQLKAFFKEIFVHYLMQFLFTFCPWNTLRRFWIQLWKPERVIGIALLFWNMTAKLSLRSGRRREEWFLWCSCDVIRVWIKLDTRGSMMATSSSSSCSSCSCSWVHEQGTCSSKWKAEEEVEEWSRFRRRNLLSSSAAAPPAVVVLLEQNRW